MTLEVLKQFYVYTTMAANQALLRRIQLRRDTVDNWSAINPVLAEGEIGYETTGSNRIKIGNGVTGWNSIPYFNVGPTGKQGPTGPTGATGASGSMLAGNWSVVASRQTGSTSSMLNITIASVSCTTRSASNPVLVSATVGISGNIFTMIWCNGTIIHQEYRNGGPIMSAGISRLHVPGVAGTHSYKYVLRSVTADGSYGSGAANPSTIPWLSFSCIEIVSV